MSGSCHGVVGTSRPEAGRPGDTVTVAPLGACVRTVGGPEHRSFGRKHLEFSCVRTVGGPEHRSFGRKGEARRVRERRGVRATT